MESKRKKRGKVLSVCLDEQKTEFAKYYEELHDENKLPPSTSQIYENISRSTSYRMTAKAVYLSLKRNHKFFFDHDIIMENRTDESSSATKTSSSDDESQCISFEVGSSTWEQIKPVISYSARNDKNKPTVKSKKRFNLPKQKWTNIMSEVLWKETKRPCTWIYKHSSATKNNFIKFDGYCSQCGALIHAYTTATTDNSAFFECKIQEGDQSVIHDPAIKNKITPFKKNELSKLVKKDYPTVVKNKIVNETMSESDKHEPPFIPSSKSLIEIRYRDKLKSYFHKIVIISLWIMAITPPYNTIIRTVSVVPFIVHYWTNLQEKYYKQITECKRKIKLSIDATGSIFKDLKPPSDPNECYRPKHIFLYVAVLKTVGRCIPIAQMITDSHSLGNIYTWLNNWVSNKSIPNEVVCDDSAALVGAIVKAFTPFKTTREYISYCFNVLGKKCTINSSHCLIRLDTSHFIKVLYNCKCFKFVDNRVRYFYVKYLVKIKNCTSFEDIKLIADNLIIIALSKYTGKCENGQEKEDGKVDCEDTDFMVDFKAKVDKMSLELELDEHKSNYENLYYFPAFIDTLKRLLSRLPLWSNVMLSCCETENITPTSSDVESYFKGLKTLLKYPTEKLRVDEFIIRHVDYLSGGIKQTFSNLNVQEERRAAKNKNTTQNTSLEFPKESTLSEKPLLLENWKGLVVKTPIADRQTSRTENQSIDLLQNGNKCPSGVKGIIVENTCAFDSVLQICAVRYADRNCVKKIFDCKKSDFSELVRAVATKDYTKNVTAMRTNILNKYYYNKSITNDVTVINCKCNISYVLDKILINDLPCVTSKKHCTNIKCMQNKTEVQRNCSYMPINILVLAEKGISALNEAAESMINLDNNVFCNKKNGSEPCKGKLVITYTVTDVLIFELDNSEKVNIDNIPNTLLLQEKVFKLLAVAEYVSDIEHYVAHCKRSNNRWECFDDLCTKVRLTKNKEMFVHSIFYSVM